MLQKSTQEPYSLYLSTLMVLKLGSQMTDFEKLIALVSSVLIPNLNVIDPFHGFNPIKSIIASVLYTIVSRYFHNSIKSLTIELIDIMFH